MYKIKFHKYICIKYHNVVINLEDRNLMSKYFHSEGVIFLLCSILAYNASFNQRTEIKNTVKYCYGRTISFVVSTFSATNATFRGTRTPVKSNKLYILARTITVNMCTAISILRKLLNFQRGKISGTRNSLDVKLLNEYIDSKIFTT